MPSPIGHALAGLTLGLLAEGPRQQPGSRAPQPLTTFTVLAALVAALPDADLLFAPVHRGWTHSFGASLLILIVAAGVTRQVTGRAAWRLATVLALAQASHVVLDWMGTDRSTPGGIQAFWPLTREFYMSGWDFFPETERNFAKPEIISMNVWAVVFEVMVLSPVVLAADWLTRRRRSRVPISAPDARRPPSA
jgi:hypothetical protein